MVKRSIIQKSVELGFGNCGFARCEPLEELRTFYDRFVSEKRFASMQYLERYAGQRLDPALVMPGAKTVIGLAMNYCPAEPIPEDDNFIIAKYAYGRDYHKLMRVKLDDLAAFMRNSLGAVNTRVFVDSGALLEKAWAQRCGIGWQGKNTLVINKKQGSFFFIGIILTDLEIEPDPAETDHCGECEKCVKACPSGALDSPCQLDIPRCISYLTIESRNAAQGEPEGNLSGRIYGCDICQDVCPYNRHSPAHNTPEFVPSDMLVKMRKKDWIALAEEDFNLLFAGSPVMRVGYAAFMKNVMTCQACVLPGGPPGRPPG
ncbi:MAG: tRNA epoxyqueuosine(34) reductase QueG [Bacteroidota bacterium]